VIKTNWQTRSNARDIRHINTENPRPLWWSEFPITFSKKDHWVHIPEPRTYPLVVYPIVNGAWLPKTLIDGGRSLNIIFTETLRKMEFDFSKMTACDEPFYGVVPGKPAYPIGRVCLPITFGAEENFITEYRTFEVADFHSSYHAIFGRPMLAMFMAIPHHTYHIMKMPAPNKILSVLGDIMVSCNCESATIELSKDSAIKAQQRSWSLRQPRSTKLLFKYRSRSVQAQLWTKAQPSRRFALACSTHPRKSSSGPPRPQIGTRTHQLPQGQR
jgi:hypothetical protein